MARKNQTQKKGRGTKPTSATTELQQEEVELDMQTETTTVAPASPVQEPNPTTNAKSSSRKTSGKALGCVVRRSARNNTFTAPPLELTVERALEEVVVTDSEGEDELEEPEPQPTFSFAVKKLEEKVDHLVQLVTEQQKIIDELKSPKNENCGVNEFTYRSLYIDSQKKVEVLTEENLELSKKLENAYGKIEVHCVYRDAAYVVGHMEKFEKFKDMMILSSLSKNTEAAANLSFEAIRGALNVGQEEDKTSPKRKRTQERISKN